MRFVDATRDLDPGRDVDHRVVEDVHDARDDDQRPFGPQLADRRARATRPRSPGTWWRCRPTPRRRRVRNRPRRTCSASGTGSAGGIRMDSAIGLSTMIAIGPGRVRRAARRLPRDGRTFPHRPVRTNLPGADGAPGRVEPQFPRRRDDRRAAVQRTPAPVPGLPAAADDGVQRQARRRGGAAGRLRHRGDLSGASPERTDSTASISCCTRGRRSCRPI